ncbi:YceI family protein [Crocinitomix catalasitica]|uniref:YceI family protein n=1 Tax=Crocinitomix catalasitica TaxID=184607 RepID=UPI000487C9A5|nr:YceI family protein [Crocinitomix catalasitica]
MKRIAILAFLIGFSSIAMSQKVMTRSGKVTFHSEATLENIEAVNNQVSSAINVTNGDLAFTMLMKAFTFEKALMQEHFNEKYVESDKFPKSNFKGSIIDFDVAKLTTKPTEFTVTGTLTIHGESKEITVKGFILKNAAGDIEATSTFLINLSDFKIEIPSTVKNNISNSIEIRVKMTYEPV